ncbi:Vacuolar protein sorting-associated protein 26 [Tritrichomonas foetus]|uniref:Vacuolar protein sorting-associated protein 26 n=1 Tax=Tritrichomonas foetus TaxID=1144522 RepID=A0A1J4J6J7_9EUKA|nr:Vacuolar protein sorting-associated protein 26 [Tritrichomonas foetus]|eukprot:OHS93061.1 Vacuolar protein sorting-associated protein 26 [Tritrichomonas foetus]
MTEEPPIEVTLSLDALKKNVPYKHPSMPKAMAVYLHGDVIKGKFSIKLKDGFQLQHKGITVSLIGRYEGNSAPSHEPFFSKVLQILPASKLSQSINSNFNFDRVALPTTSYYGTNVDLLYYVEVKIDRGVSTFCKRKQFYHVRPNDIEKTPLVKGIGITNVLHMDIILESTTVDPRVGFVGALYFELFRLRIVSVAFEIIRREIDLLGKHDSSLVNFEILDGAPVKGTLVPIRFFTGNLKLWPAPKDDKLKVEYFIKVHALDETGAIYVKLLPVNFVFQLHK